MKKLVSKSPGDTFSIGKNIGSKLRGGERIILIGELGAGKTELVKGIAAGADSNDDVSSPTFVIERIYSGRVRIRHIDLYRVEEKELYFLDIDGLLDDSDAVVIEWGEKLPEYFRKDVNTIKIDYDDNNENTRTILINDECGMMNDE